MEAEIAVIGGSGIYSLDSVENPRQREVDTPYGSSPEIVLGELEGKKVAFIPRHGKAHGTPPHRINFRANIWSLKKLGVERILATTAVGSLNPDIGPGELVLLDQFLDFTKNRPLTFYEGEDKGVFHVDMTEPYCPELREVVRKTAKSMNIPINSTGTYVCTEGPRFETAAEIQMFRQLNADVVGMTNVPESVLSRELEICYSAVSVVTNYAAGISEEKLTHREVAEVMKNNIDRVKTLLFSAVPKIPEKRTCPCKDALSGAEVEP